MLDRYYRNTGDGIFAKDTTFPEYFENGAVVKASDIDKDGDLDLFIGGRAVANDFGKIPNSYLLENTKNGFKVIPNEVLQKVGMVTDAIFTDLDLDGDDDLIIVGEWMSPTFFLNINGVFKKSTLLKEPLNGLWQTILPFDVDQDGDMDYVLGNWGLNSKYKASKENPMLMYYGDLDENGTTETIVCIKKNGAYYTLNTLDELKGQLPYLKKKFNTYHSFAGKTVEEIFEASNLKSLEKLSVHELASGYLQNNEGKYTFHLRLYTQICFPCQVFFWFFFSHIFLTLCLSLLV